MPLLVVVLGFGVAGVVCLGLEVKDSLETDMR